jgi:hypothetical protein
VGLRGTFAPFFRASDSAMAIACFRLFTVRPLLPDFSVPFFLLRIALSTRFDAALPYFRRPEDFRAAILLSVLMLWSLFPDRLARVVPKESTRRSSYGRPSQITH